MSNATRVRVELNPKDDSDYAFKKMLIAFKNASSDVQHTYKQYETYESKSRKKRRKMRESEIERLKSKLKENLTTQR